MMALSMPRADVIFRPGGVAGGNVVTTDTAVAAALDAAQGALNIFLDSSIAPANISIEWNGYGCASLFPFNTGMAFLATVEDGAQLVNFANMQGITLVCECKTTQALAFDPFSAFLLFNFGTISMAPGALVPAIVIDASNQTFAMFSRLGSLDNSQAPTVPVIQTEAGALSTFYCHTAAQNFPFLDTGNEIGGSGPGAVIYWENDNTIPPLTSNLIAPGTTVNQVPSSFYQWAVPNAGTTVERPVAPFAQLGQLYFDTTLGKPVWCTVPGPPSKWVDATGAPA